MKFKEGFYQIKSTDLFIEIHKGSYQLYDGAILITSLYSQRTGEKFEYMRVKRFSNNELKKFNSLEYHGTQRPFPPPIPEERIQ